MKRAWAVWACVAVAVFAGCKRKEEGVATATVGGGGEKNIVIGLVAKSRANDVFQAGLAGAKAAAAELGPKYGVTVEIDWQTPEQEDASRQAEFIDACRRKRDQGIAVSCSHAETVGPAINDAVKRGIVVMCFDSDAPLSNRMCYYGTDDVACGKAVLSELAKVMGNKGNVAILAGNQAAPNLQKRVQGVREEMKDHPEMKEVGVFYHEETPEKAAQKVADTQRAHPEIQGWAMVGGWPLFTKDALPWPAGQVKVVSVDALPQQLDYLRDGHVQVLLAQDCYGWGYKSVQILLDKIVKKQSPALERILDPLTRVTKENVEEYARNWDKWLGKK